MSPDGQTAHARLRPFEQAPRPLVGYAIDYHTSNDTGWHQHPRAQLLHAIEGVMRVRTETAQYIVPPGTGLWMPAHTAHITRMPSGLRMRALFLRADAARAGPGKVTVIAISPLLRELILAACEEPTTWDPRGPGRHIAALALREIRRAATPRLDLPVCHDPRLLRVTEALAANPADGRSLLAHAAAAGASQRTLARLFRRETGMSFRQWRRQLRLTEGLVRLSQGASPPRAAAAVGYASSPAFGAAFRAAFGITPGRTRRAGAHRDK
jgi:AraC-like DNA-binding protein/mannose-6-phosphate isomerase-like protein (cupin superfamily)